MNPGNATKPRLVDKTMGIAGHDAAADRAAGLPYSAVLKGYLHTGPGPSRTLASLLGCGCIYSSCVRMLTVVSEFPSLSNNPQLSNANQTSMWSSTGSRNLSGPGQRNQPTPMSSQQSGQDDIFSPPSSRMPSGHGAFRFGGQGNAAPSQGQSSGADDFPPLNRGGNGDLGSDRMSALGFGPQNGASAGANRGNGLLNALSATSRATEARSPGANSQSTYAPSLSAHGCY
jgi:hypothetical protein